VASRLTRIKEFFAPPVFPDDEDKTRAARVLNAILLVIMLLLIFVGGIAVPFVFVEKLYNGLFILAFFLTLAAARWLMQRGRVRLANAISVYALWMILTVFLLFAGGMTSIVAMFYVATTVIAGLLLGARAALVHAAVCSLTGLGMVILEISGHAPPRLFPIPALAGWVDMTIGLLLTTMVLNLVLRSLNDALALARQQIEERKRSEEALRESEERFRQMAEVIPASFWIMSSDWQQTLYVSPAFEAIYGLPSESAGQQPESWMKALHPEDREWVLAFYDERYGEKTELEYRIVRPDGAVRWVRDVVSPIRDESGELILFTGFSEDITERKQADEERKQLLVQIQEQAQRVRQIVDTVPEGVLLLNGDGQVMLANPLGEQALVILAGAKVGDSLIHLGDRPLAELLTSPPTRGLWHEVATDGRSFQIIARPLESGSGSEDWVMVIREVTQQREIQQRVQQQERLAAVDNWPPASPTISITSWRPLCCMPR
jgi:PAS domain S-box-containing protein